MKLISQSEIISMGYRLVGDIKGFRNAKKPVIIEGIES
jgi:hypothetical protein